MPADPQLDANAPSLDEAVTRRDHGERGDRGDPDEPGPPPPPHPPPQVGSRVKHYELLRQLGEGGMGTVYLARDTTLGRLVAIKVLQSHSGPSAERFLIEAQATARCRHDNIVVIHEVDEIDGYPYMVLEYLEGRTLRELINQRDPAAPERPGQPERLDPTGDPDP